MGTLFAVGHCFGGAFGWALLLAARITNCLLALHQWRHYLAHLGADARRFLSLLFIDLTLPVVCDLLIKKSEKLLVKQRFLDHDVLPGRALVGAGVL